MNELYAEFKEYESEALHAGAIPHTYESWLAWQLRTVRQKHEAQAARIERALAIETAHPDTISGGLNNVQMAVGWNEARDEFRAALTGNDEGDA